MTTLFRLSALAVLVLGVAYWVLNPVTVSGQTSVTTQSSDSPWADELKDNLTRTLGVATSTPLEVTAVRETPMEGLIEVELATGETLFSDRKGEFIVTGDLLQASGDTLVNLSALTRQGRVADWIAAVPEQEMIIFEPAETKGTITVFTDVDCQYCRKLHSEIKQINDLGIRVRYMAYPRGGEASTAFPKMISVWCSDDRVRALSQAKNGQNIPTRQCENHVLEHYNLGNRIGISGTPALVLEDGTVIPGYMDSQRLADLVLGQ